MALNELQQLDTILKSSKYILVLLNNRDNGDAVGSAIALKHLLEKQHKQVDIAASEFIAPKNLGFLPEVKEIKSALTQLQKFIIKVDVARNPIETISYDIKDDTLSIYLTPKSGLISKQELRTAQSTFKYDLIITLNTADLESLGSIFFNNTDLFYRTSIVNIDHQSSNERYGQVNVVDLTATSTAEIVYKIIKQMGSDHLDTPTATALLTGMTVATKSFKNGNITPTTMHFASELINYGADREKIIQNLYRTRSINTLKLWGQALSHLQSDSAIGLVWTIITREDFSRSGGSAEDLNGIIEELISNSPEAKVVALLFELENDERKNLPASKRVGGIIATEKNYDALVLAKSLHPEGNKKHATFTQEGHTIKEAEEQIIALLKEAMR